MIYLDSCRDGSGHFSAIWAIRSSNLTSLYKGSSCCYLSFPVQGTLGVMPLRGELREAGRVDLEKAIGRNGGFGPVAAKLNLSLAYKERKPRGYWDNLQNLQREASHLITYCIARDERFFTCGISTK